MARSRPRPPACRGARSARAPCGRASRRPPLPVMGTVASVRHARDGQQRFHRYGTVNQPRPVHTRRRWVTRPQLLLLLPRRRLAPDEPHAVEGHRHLGGGASRFLHRAFDGAVVSSTQHDAAEARSCGRGQRENDAAPAPPASAAKPPCSRPLHDREVTGPALKTARPSERPASEQLEGRPRWRLRRLPPAREAPPAGARRSCASSAGSVEGGHHRHRVHQRLHVAMVMDVAGEYALQPIRL